MIVLQFSYPVLPPSSNHIYYQGTRLTKQAKEYAERFAHFMAQNYGPEINEIDPNLLYALHLRFFFPTVVNESWFATKGRKAKDKYKKFDLSNRIKLLEDCIRDAVAVDDSHTFALSQEKHHDPQNPRIEVVLHTVDPGIFGVPEDTR